MAASFAVTLSQDDIPGASLEGRHPAELNNDALRFRQEPITRSLQLS